MNNVVRYHVASKCIDLDISGLNSHLLVLARSLFDSEIRIIP